jgi:hypothetical protein
VFLADTNTDNSDFQTSESIPIVGHAVGLANMKELLTPKIGTGGGTDLWA